VLCVRAFLERRRTQRESFSSFEKKERQTSRFFLRTERGIIVRSRSLGRRRERERERETPPRVNSPPLEKAPREREEEEEEEEERIALVDTQKTTLKNTSGGEE